MSNKILKSIKNYINNKIDKKIYVVMGRGYVYGIFSNSEIAQERMHCLAKNDYLCKNKKLKDQIKTYKDIKNTSEDYQKFILKNRYYVAYFILNKKEIVGIKLY